ncbi:hypothetical protein [Agromyces albus]|uniref:Dinucleotide-utilizing enzyme n=1 Tax=Agromyces albus TaxID=205332 RepID=A0A4Q2KVS0_9MICO|nr:hypothetical protein [Agromyces albus]RXZ68630.1 hypothetical protein ESP51_13510 [Agromyces albus]
MSNATTRRPALNIPLIVLWVAAVAVTGLGFWLLQSGNAAQADFYNEQGSDYLQYLNLQTQSTIGGMLLAAGVVGVFIALATHARNRAAAVVSAATVAVATPAPASVDSSLDDIEEPQVVEVAPPANVEVAPPAYVETAEAEAADVANVATDEKPVAPNAADDEPTRP